MADIVTALFDGLTLTSAPTETNKQLIHFKSEIFENVENCDAFNKHDDFVVAYVDPSELSYNNFENILDLDNKLPADLRLYWESKVLLEYDNIYSGKLGGDVKKLSDLHELNLYTLPFNNQTRGGRRMIFSSIHLGNILTKMIKKCNIDRLTRNFHSVNHVFRLNCFSPGDNKFTAHYDTPYADKQRNLYSRFTMIIYLTGGEHERCLALHDKDDGFIFTKFAPFTCVIFDQIYEHEGNPYSSGDKIFIRTELIYKINNIDDDKYDEIAYWFNKACYVTKESVHDSELQKYAADLFNHTAKLRYSIASVAEDVYFLKKYIGVIYMTDGAHYWFSAKYDLKDIAMIILIDYFNGKYDCNKEYNITTKKFTGERDDAAILTLIDLATFETTLNKKNKFENIIPWLDNNINVTKEYCGMDFCDGDNTSREEYTEAYELSKNKLTCKCAGANVVLFNGKLYVNKKNIIIKENEIVFNAPPTKAINFASCQCSVYQPHKYIQKNNYKADLFMLPNIQYEKINNGYKLHMDMFQNGFKHKTEIEFSGPETIKPPSTIKPENIFYDRYGEYVSSDDDDSDSSVDEEAESENDEY